MHASTSGAYLHFLRLSPRQTRTTKFHRSRTSTFTTEAVNTARQLLFMVRRPFTEYSKSAFIPVYCAIVWPHLEYAMEAYAPTMRDDTNQLERVQRLATRLVRGLRQVSYEERCRQLNLFSLERRHLRVKLILAFKIFKGKVDQSLSDFFLRPPRTGLRGQTAKTKPSSTKEQAFSVRVVKHCL